MKHIKYLLSGLCFIILVITIISVVMAVILLHPKTLLYGISIIAVLCGSYVLGKIMYEKEGE